MAKFVTELRMRLQSEQLFITNQKQLLKLQAKNVESKLSNLYLISWFLTYLKENYDKVNRTIQPIDFVKLIHYKYSLLNTNMKLSAEITYHENPNLILSTLYEEPHIIVLLFSQLERSDKQDSLARIVYSSIYGGLLTANDEFLYLKVTMELLCSELSDCKLSYELFQKGSGFKSMFAMYLENSVDVKGYYLTVLQKQIHFLMDEELFLEYEESKAEMHACHGFPGEGEYGVVGDSEEIRVKIRESAKFIGSLVTNFIKTLNQHLALTPYTVRIVANLLKREISKKWTLPVEAIQSCLANLIFGLFIVPVVADPASFGLVEDSLLTDRIRSNLNCMATVLQNLSRVNWRLLSQDLKLVFKFTNLDIYASYIDSLVLNQKSQNEVIEGEISPKKFTKNACFFYKKLEAERTHILISKQDLIFLQKSIRNISSIETLQEHNPILKQLEETKSVVMSLERAEPILQSKKKKTPTDTPNTPPKISLPRLMLFPIKERDPDQPEGFEIKSEEEIIHGKKQVTSLRDISKENTAIHSALKDSYCMDGNFLLTRSAKTRQNSVSGYETLRRGVNPMSSICDETSESSSSSEDEEDKSYEGDTSGLGSLANSNSSTYKVDTGTLKPPLPPYPSSKASVSSNTPSISVQLQDQSDSDPLEHSDEHPEVLHSKDSLIRLQRSASLGDKDCFEHLDIYQNAEELRKVSAKKSNTLVSSPKKTASISDSFPISKHFAAHDKPKVMLRSKRFKKNARNIIKTVSILGHHQKLSKRLDSLSLTKSSSNSDLKEMSTPARETQWTKLRTSTFTYMTMKSRQKAIPTSKYFTLLPLDSPTCYFQSNMNSLIKRLRLVLSTCSYPDLNIPEPDFLPIEIQQQASELGDQDNDSSEKISMPPDIANKRSLVSMLNHEFNIAISRNDIPQIALTSDLLHTIDIMSESQVAAAIDGLNKEYLARREYMQYLTTTSLKLSSQQERIITYEKFLLCQVEELEKLFMDTEARSFLLQNNTLLQLDFNLSVSDDKPLTIQNSVYFTLEQMRVDPIWHNWMYYDALLCSIERNIYNHIYYGLFFPDGITDQDDNELFRIRLNLLSKKLQIDDPFLAIHPKYYFSSPWPGALQLLHTINIYKSPRDKLDVITNCCKLITNLLHFTDPTEALGADEILPVLIFVTVNSNPKYLYANCAFLERYSDSIEKGETAYWFNQFYIAIANLKTLFKSHGIVA